MPWIKIIRTPPGEAPIHIREQWLGLKLPLAPGRPEVYEARGASITTGKELPEPHIGYLVLAAEAVGILEKKSPDAAKWWRQNIPELLRNGRRLIFDEYACELIEE
jgi:hypothetical protein